MKTTAQINRQLYAEDVSNPQLWLVTALQLLKSAEVLQEKITPMWQEYIDQLFDRKPPSRRVLVSAHYQMVQLMLAGFGFENLLKYGYIKDHQDEMLQDALNGKVFPKRLNTHDLIKLSNLVGYTPTPVVERFLRKLTAHARWSGRYPTPTDPNILTETVEYLSWSQGDWEIYYTAIEEVSSHLGINYHTLDDRPT